MKNRTKTRYGAYSHDSGLEKATQYKRYIEHTKEVLDVKSHQMLVAHDALIAVIDKEAAEELPSEFSRLMPLDKRNLEQYKGYIVETKELMDMRLSNMLLSHDVLLELVLKISVLENDLHEISNRCNVIDREIDKYQKVVNSCKFVLDKLMLLPSVDHAFASIKVEIEGYEAIYDNYKATISTYASRVTGEAEFSF